MVKSKIADNLAIIKRVKLQLTLDFEKKFSKFILANRFVETFLSNMRKVILLLLGLLYCVPVLAQVDTAWVRRYNGPENGNDYANALAVDDSGNVYVTGYSYNSGGTNPDYATIKYSSAGDTLWVRRYNGPGNNADVAKALAVDSSGNVYVTGLSIGSGTGQDYATIKYSSAGDTLWVRRYNGPGNNEDVARSLVVDGSGNVYVTGYDYGSGTSADYATIKYSSSGDTLWVRRYNSPGNGSDGAYALAVADSGNVYVTGDRGTIKYSANGDSLWFGVYGGNDLAIDTSGNVYVTGGRGTIKYSANGDSLWFGVYGGNDLAIDTSGNVYVTGSSGSFPNYDYVTIKYSSFGDTLWVRRYNSPVNDGDYAYALAVDDGGNVYVTGVSYGSGTSTDYATIKYSSSGDTLWVRRFNGPGNSYDGASALAVDGSGNLYVTGSSYDSGSFADYTTIKYAQFECLAKPGDANNDSKILLSDIVTIINFVFKSAPAPNPLCRGNTNGDGFINLSDIVYLINFIFKSGPAPLKSKECCL